MPLDPLHVWIALVGIGMTLILASLRAIAQDYETAVRWHELKVEVQNLRLEQQRRLRELAEAEGAPAPVRRAARPARRAARPQDVSRPKASSIAACDLMPIS